MALPVTVQESNPANLGDTASNNPGEATLSKLDNIQLRKREHQQTMVTHQNIDSTLKSCAIEELADLLFSERHMRHIFGSPQLLSIFTSFLNNRRPQSAAVLVYYFDALKAIRAARYANAIAAALQPVQTDLFTSDPPQPVAVKDWEEKVSAALRYILEEDLPAYITHIYRTAVVRAIEGNNLAVGPRQPKAGQPGELVVAFFLTDCSKPDNPIVFASKTFHQLTKYPPETTFGQHLRFLYGAKTKRSSICRFEEAYREVKEHCELVLSYRSDGSVYLSLFTLAPLCDSNGQVRYFLGYQIDVNSSAQGAYELQLLNSLLRSSGRGVSHINEPNESKDEGEELIGLAEMFNSIELKTINQYGGHMHGGRRRHMSSPSMTDTLYDELQPSNPFYECISPGSTLSDNVKSVRGPYRDYLLLRPFPSLQILFTSPSLRVPGILQSPFLSWIGGSRRVREGLTVALATDRSATAKIRWMMHAEDEGCIRWVHCMPLRGRTSQVGVWIVIMVNESKVDMNKAGPRRSVISTASLKTNSTQRPFERRCIHKDSATSPAGLGVPKNLSEGLTRRHTDANGARHLREWQGTCLRDDDDDSEEEHIISSGQAWRGNGTFLNAGIDEKRVYRKRT